MFLTQDDIKELTGYKNHAKQIQWLMQNGIKFLISADGSPRVLISHIEDIMGISKSKPKKSQPNEHALMQAMGMI